ncbi:MAG TPA: HEAT repeat domain-containing protein [Anaerolineaceae bacterium]|nr:HEAT repeat domain-containing protein [Anaerolineaceae bacterium]
MNKTDITGREPMFSLNRPKEAGGWRLSVQNLGIVLNTAAPEAVSIEAAEAALNHKDYYVRYNAARLLMRRSDQPARQAMQRTLQSGAVPARASAARYLYGFSWYTARPMLKKALQDQDARVREAAVYALCDCRQPAAYQLLIEALAEENDLVRAAAAWGLRTHSDPAAVLVLEQVLKAEDEDVRVEALETLGLMEIPQGIALVLHSLDDLVLAVRYAAGLSWLELCGTACLKDYATRIEQARGENRQPLLRALFHASNYLGIELSAPDVLATLLPALLAALHDAHPAARLGATWPLAWMQHPQTDEALRSAFAVEMDVDVQAEMLYIIHSLSPKLGAELLLTAESSPAEVVQQMAARLRLFR